jgi:hypothetical protein
MATKRAKKTDVVSPSSAELRKAVEAIAIQPKSGKITLLTRKLFNVLLPSLSKLTSPATLSGLAVRHRRQFGIRFERHRARERAPAAHGVGAGRMEYRHVQPEAGPEMGYFHPDCRRGNSRRPTTRRVWVEFSFAPKIKKKLLDPVQYAR